MATPLDVGLYFKEITCTAQIAFLEKILLTVIPHIFNLVISDEKGYIARTVLSSA